VKPTLDIFGPSLKKLELDFMINTQLADLAPCSQLEELTIKRCRNLDASYPTNWSWSSFLPFLKSIKSECCLGDWAPSFERKLGSLIAAQLNCCHIGTDVIPTPIYNISKTFYIFFYYINIGPQSSLRVEPTARTLASAGIVGSSTVLWS